MNKKSHPESWRTVKLKDVAQVKNGSTPSRKEPQYWNGVYPWLPTGKVNDRIITDAEEFISQKALDECPIQIIPAGSVLIAMIGQGKTRGMAAYLNIDAAINQNFASIVPNGKLDNWYLFHFMDASYSKLRQLSHGSNQGSLNCNLIKGFEIPLPPLAEQRRIAEILGAWDDAISLTQRLIEASRRRKQGLMQRLLTGSLRLPGFEGEWREVRLGDVFQRVTRQVKDKEPEHVLSITAGVGFVDQREKFGRVIAGKNLEKYILLKHGEFSYNKGNSKTYPQGCVYLLEQFDEGAVPNVFYSFRAKNKQVVVNEFYKFYFESGLLNRHLMPYINAGVRNDGLLNFPAADFFKAKILLPPANEQRAIAAVLQTADEEIGLLQRKLSALRAQKKGLMQKLLTGDVRVPTLP